MTARRASRPADIRVGTSGWSYPSGKGTWNGIFYPGAAGTPSPRHAEVRRALVLRRALRHRRSEFLLLSVPTPRRCEKWVERTPADFEFSLKLYQKFTHPDMFAKATGGDPSQLGTKDVDEFRAAIEPLVNGGQARGAARAVSRQLQERSGIAAYLEWLLKAFKELSDRRRAPASQLERTSQGDRAAARRHSMRRWRRSTSRSSRRQSARRCCPT